MILVFATDSIPKSISKSIFLAGPSPRDKETFDWKVTALEYLEKINFDGHVFIPIPKDRFYGQEDSSDWTYDNQIEWEVTFRKIADVILFWVPRDIKGKMPAFTTNIEFGEDLNTGKIAYGRPDNSEKNRYLDKRISDNHQPIFNDLFQLVLYANQLISNSSVRVNKELFIPLFIWNNPDFQFWFKKFNQHLIHDVPFVHTQFNKDCKKTTINIEFLENDKIISEIFQFLIKI